MKLLAGALVVLAFLLGPSSAFAQFPVTSEKSYKDAEISRDLQLAYAYWEKKPKCVETFMADIPGYWAWSAGCSIWIDRASWTTRGTTDRCETIVHEVGHLLGHSHSDDPTNIMFPGSPTRSVPQCEPGYVLVLPKRNKCKPRRERGSIHKRCCKGGRKWRRNCQRTRSRSASYQGRR